MPVLPNFSSFAPTPNNANAWLGGAALAQRDNQFQAQLAMEQQKLNQQAASAQMEHAMQQQRLEESTRTANMQNDLQRQRLDEVSLRAQQEMNIKSQYDQQMLGLRSQQLKGAQATLQLKTQEAARKAAAMEEWQARFPNEDPNDLARELFPRMGMGASSFNQLFDPEAGGEAFIPGSVIPIKEIPGAHVVQTSPKNSQFVPAPSTASAERIAAQTTREQRRDSLRLFTELSKLQANEEAKDAFIAQQEGGELTESDKILAEAFGRRQVILDRIMEELGQNHGVDLPDAVRNSEPETSSKNEVLKYRGNTPYAYYDSKTKKFLRYAK